jgi:hypothetical protein
MRLQTVEIFTFDELPEAIREKVRDNFRQSPDLWGWQMEHWESGQAFSRIAPIDIREADFSYGQVSIRWTDSDEVKSLSGLRAWKWLSNNKWFEWAHKNKRGDCTLTGYCADCLFADAIAEYESNPMSTPELMQVFYEAAQSWVHGGRRDLEYSYSDEAIDETIEANEYEFYSDGDMACPR